MPPSKTPFEIVNGHKPNLAHLQVFSPPCWACIPSELQCKLGLHSCCAIFMGYLGGVKGYQVQDHSSRAFFTTHDNVFDEQGPLMTADSSDEEDEDSLPTFSSPSSPSSSLAPPDSAPAPTHTASTEQGPHHSCRQHVLTEKGAAWAAKLAATCTHLDTLVECGITVCYVGCIIKDLSSSVHSGVV